MIDAFQNLSIWSARFITSGGDRHPKGSNAIPSLVEKRANQNFNYKEAGTEIGSVPVGKWEYIKPLVALRWSLHYLTPNKLGEAIVLNE